MSRMPNLPFIIFIRDAEYTTDLANFVSFLLWSLPFIRNWSSFTYCIEYHFYSWVLLLTVQLHAI